MELQILHWFESLHNPVTDPIMYAVTCLGNAGIFWIGESMKILGIDDSIEQDIISIAIKNDIKKLILFGSRARGDFKRTSDIDLAVEGGNISAFAVQVDEEVSTLLEFDIINLDGRVQKELLESIRREGVLLYEKI